MQRDLFTATQRQYCHQLSVLTLVIVLTLAGVGLGGLATPVGIASAQPITGCTEITHPGTYELIQNITNANPVLNCITIRTSDVVFDGNGFTIDGTDSPLISAVRTLYSIRWGERADFCIQGKRTYSPDLK